MSEIKRLLAYYDKQIEAIILHRQHPITGLLPASTAVNQHGNYTDAWVRDNVYSILPVWGLALAYRRHQKEGESRRAYELEHRVIHLMRGLLIAMMKQSAKVERFKVTQCVEDALHAKYDTATGNSVVGDHEWGHLQIDATSLFLLMLAQMTASGLEIIWTIDEVNFVQNLIYYISRAYRTPDYGIWERGNKLNHGLPELNASSVGMAKAALECLDGFDLFGSRGGQRSVVHIIADSVARMRITLESLLPRESISKEVDAALLSIISFPAFSVESCDLVVKTREEIESKLKGNYGYKRFLRDGHQSVLEDTQRLHYDPQELKQFENIESEWPLFYTYLLLDAIFRGDKKQAELHRATLKKLCIEKNGFSLLPELYYVPKEAIHAERENPHSQTRLPNENVPLVWAQSLFLLGEMMLDGLLTPADIDPLKRHACLGKSLGTQVKIAWLAEDDSVKICLNKAGIASQTLQEIAPIQVRQVVELASVYAQVGKNQNLKLSGRPMRRLRGLAIARVFRLGGESMVFLPMFQNPRGFYVNVDSRFLMSRLAAELMYLQRHWENSKHPLLFVLMTNVLLADPHAQELLDWMNQLTAGKIPELNVEVGLLTDLLPQINEERIEYLHQFRFAPVHWQPLMLPPTELLIDDSQTFPLEADMAFQLAQQDIYTLITRLHNTANAYEQTHILNILWQQKGGHFEAPMTTVRSLTKQLYAHARSLKLWAVVRRAAGLLGKYDSSLDDAVADIIVHQRQVQVGRSYSDATLITAPLNNRHILKKIQQDGRPEEWILTQELLLYFSHLLKTQPQLLDGIITLRASYMIALMTSEIARKKNLPQDAAFEQLLTFSPYELLQQLKSVLQSYRECREQLLALEALHPQNPELCGDLHWVTFPADQTLNMDWHHWRETDGTAGRLTDKFYAALRLLLQRFKGVIIGDKLDSFNRLDSDSIHAEMTSEEKNFILRVEHLLNKIQAPEYRHLVIEAILALAEILKKNPDLNTTGDYLVFDVLIGHAVRLAWLSQSPQDRDNYEQKRSVAWQAFYQLPPHQVANFMMQAFEFLLTVEKNAVH
ncbi:glycoside hydrolase family 15 protein [Thioflexithrix psekupsensis]|uniref:Uncharacterized protein n=1 Tax=Thioflexithrix psekupsensis TaxID=1570016 RepID=A0A251XD23_9GAMM|nr:glycoside hydrolase family 15 protein [Thioflexithrix psekupsensis]OUD16332.1 hypothetical protein TPSD3_00405 [Thioflexithrix psekupsensis]